MIESMTMKKVVTGRFNEIQRLLVLMTRPTCPCRVLLNSWPLKKAVPQKESNLWVVQLQFKEKLAFLPASFPTCRLTLEDDLEVLFLRGGCLEGVRFLTCHLLKTKRKTWHHDDQVKPPQHLLVWREVWESKCKVCMVYLTLVVYPYLVDLEVGNINCIFEVRKRVGAY